MDSFTAILICLIITNTRWIVAREGEWRSATATYTNETDGPIITGGACGYGDLHKTYGKYSAGLSTGLFNRGSTCGGCFEVRCVDHIRWCLQGSPSVIVTATDFCPPNYGLPNDYGGWCNYPREHFEMSKSAFTMGRNWGQNWQCDIDLSGQPLSFEVTSSSEKTVTSYNVAPANWQFGQTFEGKQFRSERL
eukprot:TRINITY_DN19198_c0_g1_i3.p1 TRINITY_DN19198_c0_g1~~TRINITY_DN19198_c0_g1_i3.p1  ORF type:complete len:192 (+),score=26.61 TRINITY_DN19198_c0_g1_i3:71-646(+)